MPHTENIVCAVKGVASRVLCCPVAQLKQVFISQI